MRNNTFIIHWPDSIDSYTFASKSSIVSIESLEKELQSDVALRLRGGVIYTIREIFWFIGCTRFFKPKFKEFDTKSVAVEAHDFDWVFEGKNTTTFLTLISDSADEEIWDKKSIKALIDLVWQLYRPIIIKLQFLPFVIDYSCTWMLFSGTLPIPFLHRIKFNNMDCIALYNMKNELEIVRPDTCESHNHILQYILMCICSWFIARDLLTEIKQLYSVGYQYI